MFGIIADFFSSITTILFPVFASYKALRSSDPAELTPWLMYWVVLSLILLVESWTVFIIGWIPFYSWIRLFLLSYLVLPQTQGAKLLYFDYVEPFIATHERDIDVFIGNAHERASAAGLAYLKQIIELVRQRLLGFPPTEKEEAVSPRASAGAGAYAQSLFARFTIPAARAGMVAPASDFYGMLSGAVAAATSTGKTREVQADELSASGTLFPRNMDSNTEKMDFIAAQRDKLGVLMKALDKEQQNLDLAYGAPSGEEGPGGSFGRHAMNLNIGEGLKATRSDQSFEAIEHADVGITDAARKLGAGARTTSGNWLPAGWFGGSSGGERPRSAVHDASSEAMDGVRGMSSSFDPRR